MKKSNSWKSLIHEKSNSWKSLIHEKVFRLKIFACNVSFFFWIKKIYTKGFSHIFSGFHVINILQTLSLCVNVWSFACVYECSNSFKLNWSYFNAQIITQIQSKVYLVFQKLEMFVAKWEILKESAYRTNKFVCICSKMKVSLNFTLYRICKLRQSFL